MYCFLLRHLKNVVGKKPNFYMLEDPETMDIDTPLEFNFAQYLYKENNI